MAVPCCKGREVKKHPEVEKLIEKWKSKEGALIPLLQETQDIIGYLPREVLEQIARGLGISLAKVFGVVTFYAQFHVKPRGQNIIRVCMGTACHVRGGAKIMARLETELGIKSGETTQDLNFTLESVSCIGACGLAPVITVNNDTHGRLTPDMIPGILKDYQARDGIEQEHQEEIAKDGKPPGTPAGNEEHQGTADLITNSPLAAKQEGGNII